MWAINGLDELENLEHSDRVVAVFLADGLRPSALKWLSDVWDDIHVRSGMRWHMVVPSRRSIRTDGEFDPKSFDGQLALDLARIYGLDQRAFPCLVFDNFREDSRQLSVRIPETEADRRALILAIDDFLQRHTSLGRQQLIDGLFDYLQGRSLVASLVSLAPKLASAALRSTGKLVHPLS